MTEIAKEVSDMFEIMEELENAGISPTPIRPDNFGITVKEYSEKCGSGVEAARCALDLAVTKGLLSKKSMCILGQTGRTMVYFKAPA